MAFDSIRVGFPKSQIAIAINTADKECADAIARKAGDVGASTSTVNTIHHKWIEGLLASETEPFMIVDTDVIFYGSIEDELFKPPMCGWRIPEFVDSFSGCITRSRLHTSLLYFDPKVVRRMVSEASSKVADTVFTPLANLIYPLCLPFKGRMYFYDTCSMLYHAIGGTPFTDAQKDKYCHFNFGTIEDIVFPRLPENELEIQKELRKQVLERPAMGKGQWRWQEDYYNQRTFSA